jgi:NAD-dependent SIR2 family protein deacetylase
MFCIEKKLFILFITLTDKDKEKLSSHCKLIASLAKQSALAKPTLFHHFLRALDNNGLLLRVYTQNIDGLELKAGLHTCLPVNIKTNTPLPRCIPLHGTLDELRCDSCASIFKLEPYYLEIKDGNFPLCSQCQAHQDDRIQQGKRSTRVAHLRCNVILYNETHPHGEEIARVQSKDLGYQSILDQADILLVVGTSLMVTGTTSLVRSFSKMLHKKFINTTPESPRVIYLNNTFSTQGTWNKVIDAWVEGDCEEFAKMGLEQLEEMWKAKQLDGSEAKGTLYADRQLNSGPSWIQWS